MGIVFDISTVPTIIINNPIIYLWYLVGGAAMRDVFLVISLEL